MEQSPIRLLIVDDSVETCDILENYFALTPEVTVCGVAHDGDEALFRMGQSEPDVVLLDLVMPRTDGLSVLERMSQAPMTRRPRVIITSAVGQESFTSAALSLGADYYMIKPYDLENLFARICTAASAGAAKPPLSVAQRRGEDRELLVSRSLLELGIPAHMLGYRYCSTAIDLLLRDNRPQSIVKDIYAEVAREFDTTPECVEGAIRKAIRRAWDGEQESIRTLTGGTAGSPPANGRFLTTLSQRIRLSNEGGGRVR